MRKQGKQTPPTPVRGRRRSSRHKKGGADASTTVSADVKASYIGAVGNRALVLELSDGATVLADTHSMAYMDGAVDVKTNAGGIGKAIGRFMGGESLFLNTYTGTGGARSQRVVLSVPMPGDVIELKLSPGESLKASRGVFMAATPASAVEVSGRLNAKGILSAGQQEGPVLTKITASTLSAARVWLASYGHIERHDVPQGEALLVDNENFVACHVDVNYEISKVGGIKSVILGGEGFAMKFSGPCTVYTQSKGLRSFAMLINQYATGKSSMGNLLSLS